MAEFGGVHEAHGKSDVSFKSSSHDSTNTRKDWEEKYIKKTPLFQIDPNILSGAAYRA